MSDQKQDNPPSLSRRDFLKEATKLGAAATAAGAALKNPKIAQAAEALGRADTALSNETERSRLTNPVEIPGNKDQIRVADLVSSYSFLKGRVYIPRSNTDLFPPRYEALGRAVPRMLILHTAGSENTQQILASMYDRRIGCQGVVGFLDKKAVSIQSGDVRQDGVNVSGTTSGGPTNSFEANMQMWEAFNIEIAGHPDRVDPELIDKTVEFCLNIMAAYDIKLSQVVGHMEAPNNGKPDPGAIVLKEVRTRIFKELAQNGMYDLVDVFPDDRSVLQERFDIQERHSGPANLNDQGEIKCWLKDEDDFLDWQEADAFLDEHPKIKRELRRYREGKLTVKTGPEFTGDPVEEVYLGYPIGFTNWLREPSKPLDPSTLVKDDSPGETARFVYEVVKHLNQGEEPLGKKLPLDYKSLNQLAMLYIGKENSEALEEAMHNFQYSRDLKGKEEAWRIIQRYYQRGFNQRLEAQDETKVAEDTQPLRSIFR